MEQAASTRLTAAAGRRFAFTLAAAFALLAALAIWRDAIVARNVFGLLFALLALLGVLAPTRLGPLERAWMAFGLALSRVTTPVIFTALWWIGVVPLGVIRRTVSRSPLARDPNATSYWHERPVRTDAVARQAMERQF